MRALIEAARRVRGAQAGTVRGDTGAELRSAMAAHREALARLEATLGDVLQAGGVRATRRVG